MNLDLINFLSGPETLTVSYILGTVKYHVAPLASTPRLLPPGHGFKREMHRAILTVKLMICPSIAAHTESGTRCLLIIHGNVGLFQAKREAWKLKNKN